MDKPILLASFTYQADVPGLNHFPPEAMFEILPNQNVRADRYESYMRRAYTLDNVVGAHWFMYSDQPAAGRHDGENSNFGQVDIIDEPYSELTARMSKVTQDTRWSRAIESSAK